MACVFAISLLPSPVFHCLPWPVSLPFHYYPALYFIVCHSLCLCHFITTQPCISLLSSTIFHYCFIAVWQGFIAISLLFHCSLAKFHLWEKITQKGNYRALFKDPKYTKIILIAAFINETNPKYLTKCKFEGISFTGKWSHGQSTGRSGKWSGRLMTPTVTSFISRSIQAQLTPLCSNT